jgi:hypothetical protein
VMFARLFRGSRWNANELYSVMKRYSSLRNQEGDTPPDRKARPLVVLAKYQTEESFHVLRMPEQRCNQLIINHFRLYDRFPAMPCSKTGQQSP